MLRLNDSLKRTMVRDTASLLDAMRAVNSGYAIAFVVNDRSRVIGSITDGDLRRAILAGIPLSAHRLKRVVNRQFVSVSSATPRVDVLDMMRARGVAQVPVLDARGRLVGLHLLQDLIGGAERPNWAVIMAGGKGERLRPLTLTIPKPMITVAGRPILERLVLHLVGAGIRRIFLSVNYLSEVIEHHFGDGSDFGCRIEYLREKKPLGTGGALALLPSRPRHSVITLNGDLVTQVNVGRLLDFHDEGKFAMSIGLRTHEVIVPFGVASVRGKRIVALREKPSERLLINAGVYVVSPRAIGLVPRKTAHLMTTLAEQCISRRWPVGGFYIQDEWADVGLPDELRRVRGDG